MVIAHLTLSTSGMDADFQILKLGCVKHKSKMLYIQANRRTLGRVSKPAAQLELETTGDDDDEDLIPCRFRVAEPQECQVQLA